MAFIGLCYAMWAELFMDSVMLGKILLAPFWAVASVVLVIVAIPTFVLIDLWCILLIAFLRDVTVAEYFAFWF